MRRDKKMKRHFYPSLALSLFLSLGNAQDNTLPVSTVYATQGNAAKRQSLEEVEMQAAIQAAREKKALMAAMSAYAMPQQVITTPAQFLLANPPRVPAAPNEGESAGGSIEKKNDEVPMFEPAPGVGNSSTPPIKVAPTPAPKVGLFDLLKAKNRKNASVADGNPYAMEQPSPPESISNTSEVSQGAPVQTAPNEPVGGIFKRGDSMPGTTPSRDDSDSLPVAPASDATTVGSVNQGGNGGGETAPSTPSGAGMTQPDAPIFIRRQSSSLSGETASLKSTAEAEVGGVMVSVWEGTEVKVLSKNGGMATIQLPDQRVGTINASALAQ